MVESFSGYFKLTSIILRWCISLVESVTLQTCLPSVFISVLIYNIMDHFVGQTCSSGRQLLIDIIAV